MKKILLFIALFLCLCVGCNNTSSTTEQGEKENKNLNNKTNTSTDTNKTENSSQIKVEPNDSSQIEAEPNDGSQIEAEPNDSSQIEAEPNDGSQIETEPNDGFITVWLLENTYTVKDGEEILSEANRYDEEGKLLEKLRYSLDIKHVYEYNEYGHMTKDTTYEDGREYFRSEYQYTYDNNGKPIELIIDILPENDNYRDSKYLFTYDDNGNLTTLKLEMKVPYEEEIDICYETSYTYDANGNLILEETSKDGGFYRKKSYAYDEKGNLTSYSRINEKGSEESYTYAYNKEGKLTSELWFEDGVQMTKKTCLYLDGNIIQNGIFLEYYDEYGNKIERKDIYNTIHEKYTYVQIRITPGQNLKLQENLKLREENLFTIY